MIDFSKPNNYSDIVLKFETNSGYQEIHTSRYLLCVNSKVLHDMLNADVIKSAEFIMPKDDLYEGFLNIIKYLVNMQIELNNDNIIVTFCTAHKYEFTKIEEICKNYKINFTNINHCIEIYHITQIPCNVEPLNWLAQQCPDYISNNLTKDNIVEICNKLVDINFKCVYKIFDVHNTTLYPILKQAKNITELRWEVVSRIAYWKTTINLLKYWLSDNKNYENIDKMLQNTNFTTAYKKLDMKLIAKLTDVIKRIPDINIQNRYFEYIIDYYESRFPEIKRKKVN